MLEWGRMGLWKMILAWQPFNGEVTLQLPVVLDVSQEAALMPQLQWRWAGFGCHSPCSRRSTSSTAAAAAPGAG